MRVRCRLNTSRGTPLDRAADYAEQSIAPATRCALSSDWAYFSEWCKQQQLVELPAEPMTVAAYIADMATEASIAKQNEKVQHSLSAAPSLSLALREQLVDQLKPVVDRVGHIAKLMGDA